MKTNRKTDSNTENTKKSDGKITLRKIIGHFKTITRHRHTVIAHSRLAGILFQGLRHDLSKYSPTELSRARGFTAETGARTKRNAHFTDIRRRGCIIKAETDIILNIGLIIM